MPDRLTPSEALENLGQCSIFVILTNDGMQPTAYCCKSCGVKQHSEGPFVHDDGCPVVILRELVEAAALASPTPRPHEKLYDIERMAANEDGTCRDCGINFKREPHGSECRFVALSADLWELEAFRKAAAPPLPAPANQESEDGR